MELYSEEPNTFSLLVRDQGIGIPEKEQKNLFQPFFRARNTSDIPGTGLGLVITKKAIELHQGQICFESKAHVGTTFIVTMPQKK